MPAISGWSSGIAPQPISVGITGTPVASAKRTSSVAGVGVDDAAAGHDQRALGRVEHRDRLLDLGARGGRLVERQRLVGVDVELDLRHLHVEGQVDQHRARAARAHQVEGLLEHLRHLARLAHRDATTW